MARIPCKDPECRQVGKYHDHGSRGSKNKELRIRKLKVKYPLAPFRGWGAKIKA